MKPLIISASELEGGAPRAALRLHQGWRHQQVDSQMLVQKKLGNAPHLMAPETSLDRSIATMRRAVDALRPGIERVARVDVQVPEQRLSQGFVTGAGGGCGRGRRTSRRVRLCGVNSGHQPQRQRGQSSDDPVSR